LIFVTDSQDIQKLQKTFHEIMNINSQIQVKSFIETKLTLMKLIYLRIVSVQSAGTSHILMFYIIIIDILC
jgi:hypothetical protein